MPWQFYLTGGGRSNNVATTIPVPSCWQTKGFGSYSYGNHTGNGTVAIASATGTYSTTFTVPSAWAGERIFLVYEGVLTDTATSLNGQPLDPVHQGGFVEFSYDVTSLIRVGPATNVLNVTVNEWSANASINQAEREGDYWNFSGIFRPVYLKAVPRAYIDRVAVNAQADGQIAVTAYLGGIDQNYTLQASVLNGENVPLGNFFSSPVPAGSTQVTLAAALPTPQPWSAESPTLYKLTVQLVTTNNAVLHTITNQIGFRTITFVNQRGYLVNGHKVVLRGICRHEFWPTDGRTSSRAESDLDIGLIKDMNLNAVRLTHYPPAKEFLDECDRLGLYVFDELPGWQQAYDNTVAPDLVKALVVRDVNHPSIIAWDNGNEGGWNTSVDNDGATSTNYYALWDPQKRHVNRPSSIFNNVQDDHYPGYFSGNLGPGKMAYSATEILHGLFDGGGGASVTDYWDLMRTATNGIGMFLWGFADEGLVRDDLSGAPVDVQDQNAPDGMVGPYRQPEASYYTLKSVFNPVQIVLPSPPAFTGNLNVENRFDFTRLDQCHFRWQLGWYPDANDPPMDFSTNALAGGFGAVLDSGWFSGPALAPGMSGTLSLPGFPASTDPYDALRLTVSDPFGQNLYTWTWPWRPPVLIQSRLQAAPPTNFSSMAVLETSSEIVVTNGSRIFHFNKQNGMLAGLSVSNQPVSLGNGPRSVTGIPWAVGAFTNFSDGTNYYIQINDANSGTNAFRWAIRPDGWLQLNYQYWATGTQSWLGITFDYPSNNVMGMNWLGQGPYREYKNRLAGQEVFAHTKTINYTSTGRSPLQQPGTTPWIYPEFAGYYGKFYWAALATSELPILITTPVTNLFLRVLTPPASGNPNADTVYPAGNLSFLHGISPIGDKFHAAANYGPSAALNTGTGLYTGEIRFYFGALPSLPGTPTNLIATAAPGQVGLVWAQVSNAAGYNLKVATNFGGPYTLIASNLSVTNFLHQKLLNGITYYYVISALSGNGEGKASAQVSATTPVLPPQFGAVTLAGSNLIMTGTNGTPSGAYLILTTTNLTLPISGWSTIGTNQFDAAGGFQFTNPLNLLPDNQFYRVQIK
ncbi:MAG TPA: glycoside hydrolase family 2 TIM barrel-domain containing protein [Verrucomicrobiae bacterium]